MDYINIGLIILFTSTLSFIEASNFNCNGKAFHCVNSTHFKICVDLGGGVSTTVDEFLIPCPQNTVCKPDNFFECEYELPTTLSPVTIQSEVTNELFQNSDNSVSEKLDITTLFPTKQPQVYYNKVNATPARFTKSFLTDAVITPVPTGNPNDLHTSGNSDINKTLDSSRSSDKELRFSTTESGINVTQTLPYNAETLVTDIGVSNNYNIESPIVFSTTNNTKSIDPIKKESLEPLNKNSLDLDTKLRVTKRMDQVSTVSELQNLAPVTLLPGNFSDYSLQENGTTNINPLIKSENTNQESNKDLLIKLNNVENNTQYRNTDINTLNSTTRNVRSKSKVNSAITQESLGQHFAGTTTASIVKVPGPTNQFTSDSSINGGDAIETFLNNTTNLEKISITERDIMKSTSTIRPETSIVKINELSSQIINSGFNYEVSSVVSTNPIFDKHSSTPSNNIHNNEMLNLNNTFELNPTTKLNNVNISQYLTSTEPYLFHESTNMPISSTSKSEFATPINISEVLYLRSKKSTQVSQINDVNTMNNVSTTEVRNNITAETANGVTSMNPILDFNSKNETLLKPVMATVATDIASYNATTTEVSNNMKAEISKAVTSLKSIPDLILKNETLLKPVMATVATDIASNNATTTEVSNNMKAEISNAVTSLKSTPDLILKNETLLNPVMATITTDIDSNNVTTTEVSNNMTAETSNAVTSLKSTPDLISKNETLLNPVMATVATDIDSNNVTTTEISNNMAAEISSAVMSLKSTPDLISKNETLLNPVMATVATGIDSNNVTTTEVSNNMKAEISNAVTSLKSTPDLILNNETLLNPVMATITTDIDSNNVTTIEVSNNMTAETSNAVTSLKSTPDLISKNETLLNPVMATVATDIDRNNVTTTEIPNNITAETSNRVTSLNAILDLISKNKTLLTPVMATVATDIASNNATTTEVSNNMKAEISNAVTSLKSTPDLILNNETLLNPVMATITTDIDSNNVTTTEVSNNMTAETSNAVTSLKSTPDLISKNETLLNPAMATIATDIDRNNVTTTEVSNNMTAETSNAVTSLKSTPDLISKNETLLNPVMVTVATDIDRNNITTTEVSNNMTAETSNAVTSLKSTPDLILKNETLLNPLMATVATDLDRDNVTTTEIRNNITAESSNRVTSMNSIVNLISRNETLLKPPIGAVATNIDRNNITTTEVRNNITAETSNAVASLKSRPDLISKNETDLCNNNISTTKISNYIIAATHNNDTTKPIINSLYEKKKALSFNSTLMNRTPDVYQSTTKSDTAFITPNSMDVTNNTFAVIDVLSENRVVSDNNKTIEKAVKLESTITTKPLKHFYTDMNSKPVISLETKTVTTLTSELVTKENNLNQVIYKNTSDNDQISDINSFVNRNLTKQKTENFLLPKLVTTIDSSLSPALNLTYTNNNISDKNNKSLSDIEIKHNHYTNSLLGKPLIGVINSDLNFTDKNPVSSVASKSKSIPLVHLRIIPTKPPLLDIDNTSHSYFSENISQTSKFDRTTASNKFHETEGKESIQTKFNKNELVHAISNIEHKENKTVHLVPNPFKQVTKTAVSVNDTTLKESYNFLETSLPIRRNIKYDFIMENITTEADKNTAPKYFYGTKSSSYSKNNSKTIIKTVNGRNCTNCSTVADYFQLNKISNSQLAVNVIKPLLIEHEPLQEVDNITVHGFQGHDSVRINKSEINNKQKTSRSELIAIKNITSTNIFSGNIINNRRVVNRTVGAAAIKTFKQDRNVSEVKNLSVKETKQNYTNYLYAASESSITANNLLKNMSSQTYSIKNKVHEALPSNAFELSRIPSEFYKSSQSEPLKMETTTAVSNTKKIEIVRERDKITISDHTNRSNGNEKKQIRTGYGSSQSILTNGNALTKNIRNNTQNNSATPIININNYAYKNPPTNQDFNCTKRGKYSNTKDCHRFYVCIGPGKPIIGVCPTDTVFSEYLKQCTKNVTHCIRNNQFMCTAVGRFNNILCNNSYFICVKNNSRFIRFTLHCQKGYYLDKNNIKCTPELKNISISDENSSKTTKELSFDNFKEMKGLSLNSTNVFECEKEGKFKDPQDCRKYYVCKKSGKSVFRRKIKKCDSDEVFHRKKKKCVDAESNECDI